MRYVWASLVAVGILSFAVYFVRHTRTAVEHTVRESAAASGRPMPDLSSSKKADVGIEMSSGRILQVSLADFLFEFWYVFVILVLFVCFGSAALVGRLSNSSRSHANTSEP
jgi:hypothetical protein